MSMNMDNDSNIKRMLKKEYEIVLEAYALPSDENRREDDEADGQEQSENNEEVNSQENKPTDNNNNNNGSNLEKNSEKSRFQL